MHKTYLEGQTGEEIVLTGEMANDLVFQIIFGLVFQIEFWKQN